MKPLPSTKRKQILDLVEGSALARARDYGIDLSPIVLAVERSPQESLERLIQAESLAYVIVELRGEKRRA